MTDALPADRASLPVDVLWTSILAISDDAIFSILPNGLVGHWNPAAERLFGYSSAEMAGCPESVLIPEESVAEAAALASRISRDHPVEHVQTRRKHKNGRVFEVFLTVSMLANSRGELLGKLAVARTCATPKQTVAHLRAFLESAPDAIVVVNGQGAIVLANHLTEEMFGYTHAELVGQPVEMLMPHRYRKAHLGDRTAYAQAPQTRPMGAGRALTGQKKNGSEFPIEVSLSPLQDEAGTLVISIIRDLTERLRAEAKFRGLLESAPDGIVVVDTKGQIVMVNSETERLFGYSREELLGQRIEVLVPDRFKAAHIGDRASYASAPRTRPMGAGRPLAGRKKDGTEIPIEISLSPLETEQGTFFTSIIRDITERRRAEEQIQASLREKEVLLREIHHRVKNNLQVTSSLLNLQSAYIRDRQAKDLFAQSQNRIRSMALVHEKLYQSSDLSRINFSEYLDGLARLLCGSFGVDPSQIRIKTEVQPVFLTVETAVPCGLIVNELLSNSLKHAFPEGRQGEIIVRVQQEHENLTLTVADNGLGVPPALDVNATETLGLQLVRTLARQLNGTLQVKSGPWTQFTVVFPMAKT